MTLLRVAVLFAAFVAASSAAARATDVLTYHVDALRTGWNGQESQLNTTNVGAGTFGRLVTVALDGRVDAEPLVVSNQPIDGHGTTDVVYVATEHDTLYALGAADGSQLWSRHFGAAVPYQYKSGDTNVYPEMGILGTPVIDRSRNALYLVADTFEHGHDVFRIHAVALNNGADLFAPVVVQASTTNQDGTTFTFASRYALQRAALLESGGIVYVAFGSNGDINPNLSRGTLLAYGADSLAPFDVAVTDRLDEAGNFYLSSIWQSGYGIAADVQGNVFFATGNSDPSVPTYDPTYNHPDSVLKVSSDLRTLLDSFTPSNYFALDQGDMDLGSGGTMLLPDQPPPLSHLAVVGGKDGRAFLLNRDLLGGYTPNGPDAAVATFANGSCWCGPAYFVGNDGVSRIVTGGANGVTTWTLSTVGGSPLSEEGSTGAAAVWSLPDDGGVVPAVSSNGTAAGTAIVWFVQRPTRSMQNDPGTPVTLYAVDGSNVGRTLYAAAAGTWRNALDSNADIVPTVANGRVYVASNKQLQIFGLVAPKASVAASTPAFTPAREERGSIAVSPPTPGRMGKPAHEFYGEIVAVHPGTLLLRLRSGQVVVVDVRDAVKRHATVLLYVSRPIRVRGDIGSDRVFHASAVWRAHADRAFWPRDD